MRCWCMQIFQFLRVVVATADGTAVMNKVRYAACGIPSGHAQYPGRCENLCGATAAAQAPALRRAPRVNMCSEQKSALQTFIVNCSEQARAHTAALIHPHRVNCTERSWA